MMLSMRCLVLAGTLLAAVGIARAAEITVGDTTAAIGPLSLEVVQGQVLNLDVYGLITSPGDGDVGGYEINVELRPQGTPVGTLQFTSGANDITEIADPFGGGIFTSEDSDVTGSPLTNDAAKTSPGAPLPLNYDGPLVRFPVVASAAASGTWDVALSFTATGAVSQWTPSGAISTVRVEGTITVVPPFCNNAADCVDGTCSGGTNAGGACSSNAACLGGGTCVDNPCTDNVCSAGSCSNPPNSNSCDDGNLCTTSDVCSGETCGGSPVVCLAVDQCHIAGTCDPATGSCDNPFASDTTPCDDGLACTQSDFCNGSGACIGGSLVTCTALDQCHAVGVCTEPDGVCTNPNQPDGTTCTDGNPCTLPDVCSNGVCVSSSPTCLGTAPVCQSLICLASDGLCQGGSNNGLSCSDDAGCPGGGVCTVGVCSAGSPSPGAACTYGSDCTPGTCELACSTQAVSDGTACDDLAVCTENDQCVSGACTGTTMAGCATCSADADCDGFCSGGNNAGTPCVDNTVCTGGGICALNPNPMCQNAVCTAGICTYPSTGACPTLALVSVPGPTTCYDPVLTCAGGTNAANPCTSDADCPGGACQFPGAAADPTTNEVVVNVVMNGMGADAEINRCLGGVNHGGACASDLDCVAASGTCNGIVCTSGADAGQPCNNDADCHVRCNKIVGGQFFLNYDQTKLEYQSIAPGPLFPVPLLFSHDAVNGTIDYSVSITLGDAGTSADGSVMAAVTFKAIAACDPDATVNFRTHTPPNNVVDTAGSSVTELITDDMVPVRIDGLAPDFGITCPADINVHADAGAFSAAVSWPPPIAIDACDGARAVSCVKEAFQCSGSGAVCAVDADCPPAETCSGLGTQQPIGLDGDTFAVGRSRVTCTATDVCGNGLIAGEPCVFDVVVTATSIVQVDVELAGADGDMLRCITFELSNCSNPAQAVEIVEAQMLFTTNPPGVAPSRATGVSVTVPAGVYTCITAQDRLHTLRTTESITDTGVIYTASFDSSTGGTPLRSGDMNDDGYKDIIDFAILNSQFNAQVAANTDCLGLPIGAPTPSQWNADLSGNGIVDTTDFSIFSFHFAEYDAVGCCAITAGLGGDRSRGPTMEIAVGDLESLGLQELSAADLNGDGWVDLMDVATFAAGNGPGHEGPTAPEKSLRRPGHRKH
ncbi:MAG: cohesin domain-containing protein [Phycisphaerae bacterium]